MMSQNRAKMTFDDVAGKRANISARVAGLGATLRCPRGLGRVLQARARFGLDLKRADAGPQSLTSTSRFLHMYRLRAKLN